MPEAVTRTPRIIHFAAPWAYIHLTKGKVCIVDWEEYEELNKFSWQCSICDYATRLEWANECGGWKNRKTVFMHKQVLGAERGQVVDHINGNKLDNRRVNLRLATRAENRRNSRPHTDSSSRYKGVTLQLECTNNPWKAEIRKKEEGIYKYLGCFPSEEEAARAYDAAAVELFGSFARLNFPEGS